MGNYYSKNSQPENKDDSILSHSLQYNWTLSYPQKKLLYMSQDHLEHFTNKKNNSIISNSSNNSNKDLQNTDQKLQYKDLRSVCPDILSDNGFNLSAINTVCFVLHYQLIRNKLDIFPPSRLFIYNNIESLKNKGNTMSFDLIFKSIQTYGFCSELSYSYNKDNYNTNNISNSIYNDAEQYKYINIYRIHNSVDTIKNLVSNNMIIIIGFIVYNNIHNNYEINLSDTNTNSILGGTTGTIVGYVDSQQSFIVALSYGNSIGKEGYILLPYKYIEDKDLVPELYYIDFDKTQIESFIFNNKKRRHNIPIKDSVPQKPYGGLFSKH